MRLALRRAKLGIITIALTYGVSVGVGLLLVHLGNHLALEIRDRVVGTAWRESAITQQFRRGNAWTAAAMDAAGNAGAALTTAVAGYCPPAAYALAAYRGWIGGVVSVDDAHRSRLATQHEALYYLVTVLLQLVPSCLVAGAGVNLGYAAFLSEKRTGYEGPRVPVLRIPYEAIGDAGWLCLIALPLFAIASCFEFLM